MSSELEISESITPESDSAPVVERPIDENISPEPDIQIVDPQRAERLESRAYITKWMIPCYVLSVGFSLIAAVVLAVLDPGHSFTAIEHILSLVVASLGPVIGFYFAEDRS